jgi:hypothetical protein
MDGYRRFGENGVAQLSVRRTVEVGSRSGAVSLRFGLPGAPRFLWDWTH